MWVGGTEENLAAAFTEARQGEAVLLLDEVDSFLQDRRRARQSWEISGVNEMLTQMEQFDGFFIASTNLMQGLDPAALRRFDLKLPFGYLRPDQAWDLFRHQAAALGLPAPAPALADELRQLPVLTPGDFAIVARQHAFGRFTTAEQMLSVIKEECALKEDGPRPAMGFL